MNVLLIDDHPVIHLVMRSLVHSAFPCATFHSATVFAAGLQLAREIRQNLALLDLCLPGCRGIEAVVRFRCAFPDVPVAVISVIDEPTTINAALDAGALGYIPKTSPPKVIIAALKLVAGGAIYIPPEARQCLTSVPGMTVVSGQFSVMADRRLTRRQTEVLRLITRGYHNRQIASELDVSESTVKQHVHAVFNALGVSSRTQAIASARRMNFD